MIKNEKDVRIISDLISKNFPIEKIILFGSYAKGTNTVESDIDICLLTNGEIKKLNLVREIRKKLYSHVSKPLDLLIYKTDEFYERANTLQSIEKEIIDHGVYLYG